MTPAMRKQGTVTLTRDQLASILHDMGWEDEDVSVLWRLARREMREPGCLARERRSYWARVMKQFDLGGQ